ncbi:MAG: MBL fold metallo-hydrolase [Myxococcales bacterium]|nr:MBL fold metallo-hydrolase [Myxococcales bacterium]MCB9646917.1 MBL fold metallo-hydrolase [Deltaproteobacteria bacterium]
MYLEFWGAAGGVTGSLHRVHVGGADVLLDCGLFQGRREETNRLNREVPPWALEADALLLSHAHLDHSGNIPTLVRRGFKGNIYATPPTRDLCSVMLRDSAMIQAQDTAYLNRKAARAGSKHRLEPLYTTDDVQAALQHMISVPLHRPMPVAPGVTATFHNSGHVLGSALVQLDMHEEGRRTRLLFTGDLGREELPLLDNPEVVDGVRYLMIECTYGDRTHPDVSVMDQQLGEIVDRTIKRGGKVLIPTFALERAQEVLFALSRLAAKGAVPEVPIYIDSPLAIAITEIYKLHPEGLDDAVQRRLLDRDDPFSPPNLRYVADVSASRAIQQSNEPCIVIAGSGMCEGGRILHHLAKGLGNSKNSVVIVGFMADHTLGRRLIEGHRKVKVFGLERDVWAEIHKINGLSAHADREDLLSFVEHTAARGHLEAVVLVHGEDRARAAMAESLKEMGIRRVVLAQRGERLELSTVAERRQR